MAAVVTDAILDRVEKNSWRIAAQWGLGVLVSLAVALWFGWRATSHETFIRGQLLENNKAQATVISQNSELLKQNTEAMLSSQTVIEQCTRSNGEVCKILDRVIGKLEK